MVGVGLKVHGTKYHSGLRTFERGSKSCGYTTSRRLTKWAVSSLAGWTLTARRDRMISVSVSNSEGFGFKPSGRLIWDVSCFLFSGYPGLPGENIIVGHDRFHPHNFWFASHICPTFRCCIMGVATPRLAQTTGCGSRKSSGKIKVYLRRRWPWRAF